MTDVETVIQRYYGDRPVIQRIDDALRAAGVDPEWQITTRGSRR